MSGTVQWPLSGIFMRITWGSPAATAPGFHFFPSPVFPAIETTVKRGLRDAASTATPGKLSHFRQRHLAGARFVVQGEGVPAVVCGGEAFHDGVRHPVGAV